MPRRRPGNRCQGEAALPVNRDAYMFVVVLHLGDDTIHQVPHDVLQR
jgi:hypothetical protein